MIAFILLILITALGSFIGILSAPSPSAKAECLALFISVFSVAAFAMSWIMIRDGQIPVGRRGMPTDEYIDRGEEPLKFWAIWSGVIAVGILLVAAAVFSLMKGSSLFR